MVSVCISPTTSGVEHLSTYLLSFHGSSLEKEGPVPIFKLLGVFLLLSCMSVIFLILTP